MATRSVPASIWEDPQKNAPAFSIFDVAREGAGKIPPTSGGMAVLPSPGRTVAPVPVAAAEKPVATVESPAYTGAVFSPNNPFYTGAVMPESIYPKMPAISKAGAGPVLPTRQMADAGAQTVKNIGEPTAVSEGGGSFFRDASGAYSNIGRSALTDADMQTIISANAQNEAGINPMARSVANMPGMRSIHDLTSIYSAGMEKGPQGPSREDQLMNQWMGIMEQMGLAKGGKMKKLTARGANIAADTFEKLAGTSAAVYGADQRNAADIAIAQMNLPYHMMGAEASKMSAMGNLLRNRYQLMDFPDLNTGKTMTGAVDLSKIGSAGAITPILTSSFVPKGSERSAAQDEASKAAAAKSMTDAFANYEFLAPEQQAELQRRYPQIFGGGAGGGGGVSRRPSLRDNRFKEGS